MMEHSGLMADDCVELAHAWLEEDMCKTSGAVAAEPNADRVASLAQLLRAERSRARRAAREEALVLLTKLRDSEPEVAPAPPRPPPVLQEEYETYMRFKPSLLETAKGKYALIKGHHVLGVFDEFEVAYGAGLKRLGNVPMFIHKVVEVEPVVRLRRARIF